MRGGPARQTKQLCPIQPTRTGFDLKQLLRNLDAVNPGVERILTSARTGQGVDEWCSWLEQRVKPA